MARQETELAVTPLPRELADLARAVVARHHAAELESFDDMLADFEADPDGTVRGVELGAPVGMGVELVAMTPWVLAAAGVVGGVLAEKAAGDAYAAARRWLARALARRRGEQVVEREPADEGPRQVVVLVEVRLVDVGVPADVARTIAVRVVEELEDDGAREAGAR